jgi:hypothetical protein
MLWIRIRMGLAPRARIFKRVWGPGIDWQLKNNEAL